MDYNTKRVLVSASQPRPHIKPLPYYVQYTNGSGTYSFGSFHHSGQGFTSHVRANNKALDKMSEISDQAADLMVAFLERQSAIDMMTDGLTKIARIARAIRKKDPRLMRKVLYGKSKAEKRMIASRPANIWLAYHFGIVPTIMDIHHAMGVLTKDAPVLSVKSVGMGEDSDFSQDRSWRREVTTKTIVKLGGDVTHVNRNAMLAGQLGFTQPLSTVWEMTPFSWFVDYFVNVGDMLSNLEPRFPGITFENQYTTRFFKAKAKIRNSDYPPHVFVGFNGTFTEVERQLGWPSKMLDFNGLDSLSGQRVSYIASVVVSILSGFKK